MSLLPQERHSAPSSLWTPEFILLFLLSMFANSYIAVFYSFEHWLVQQHVSAQWRGILLGCMGLAVLCTRPVISVWLLRHRGLWLMGLSLLGNSLAMCAYSQAQSVHHILLLRIMQGICLATMHSAVVAMLVDCFPKGQSARGFAMFSLTMLLPYSIIPSVSEHLLPLVGGESHLYALTSLLGIPALCMIFLLSRRFKGKPVKGAGNNFALPDLWRALRTSGLGPIFWASGLFGAGVVTVIFFIKGLSHQSSSSPAAFFMTYTVVVMVTRLLTNTRLDSLPRLPTMIGSALALSAAVAGFALAPAWILPLSVMYGVGLGLIYPMMAAAIYDGSTEGTRSLNSNIMMLTYDASNVLAPLLGGTILELGFGYTGVFFNGSFIMALAAFSAYIYKRRQGKEKRTSL